jgi:hypothetical protein
MHTCFGCFMPFKYGGRPQAVTEKSPHKNRTLHSKNEIFGTNKNLLHPNKKLI